MHLLGMPHITLAAEKLRIPPAFEQMSRPVPGHKGQCTR